MPRLLGLYQNNIDIKANNLGFFVFKERKD